MSEQASKRPKAPLERGWVTSKLIQELADGRKTMRVLAKEYGVTSGAISQFKTRHKPEIEAVRAALEEEFADLWITAKRHRIAEYQADVDQADTLLEAAVLEDISPIMAAKHRALRAVAEELGDLPTRAQKVEVSGGVKYELVGLDPKDLV